MARLSALGAWVAAAISLAACGNSVTTGGGGNGGTGGGIGGIGGSGGVVCALEAVPCCDPSGPSDPCCALCPTTTTGTGGIGGTGGTGGGGQSCGGFAGTPCGPDEYCDFFNNLCGGDDGSGYCTPRPQGCPDIYQPTCGCDGQVHTSPCDANASGTDVDNLGGCTPPAGMFGCGALFCDLGSQYCQMMGSDTGGPSIFSCQPLPTSCGTAPSCACLSGVTCGGDCMATQDGGLQVTCLGG